MADNMTVGQSGYTVASDDISGVHYERFKLIIGVDGTNSGDVSASNPLPITGTVTANAGTGTFTVSGTVTANAGTGTFTCDTELPAAVTLADTASAAPTTPTVGSIPLLMNASSVDRQRAVVNTLDSTGTGIAAAGLVGQLDDTSTSSVTENQFAPVRISTRRALLVEGVASGTAQPISGTVTANAGSGTFTVSGTVTANAGTGTFTCDTELPAAAALADGASAVPSTPTVGAVGLVMNASSMDRQRAVVNSLDSTGTGIAAAGLVGQLDDSGTSTVTENQFSTVRISSRRALLVEGVASGTAQPVSGTVAATQSGSNWTVNVAQLAGTTTDTNSGTKSAGTLRVVLATDQPQLTNALKVDGSAVTQPVSGTVTANAGSGTFTTKETRSGTATGTSVSSSATSVQLLASTAGRLNATFFNDSTATLYLKLGTTAATTDYTVQLLPNAYYELPWPVYTGRIDGIWTAANGKVYISELT